MLHPDNGTVMCWLQRTRRSARSEVKVRPRQMLSEEASCSYIAHDPVQENRTDTTFPTQQRLTN